MKLCEFIGVNIICLKKLKNVKNDLMTHSCWLIVVLGTRSHPFAVFQTTTFCGKPCLFPLSAPATTWVAVLVRLVKDFSLEKDRNVYHYHIGDLHENNNTVGGQERGLKYISFLTSTRDLMGMR